MKSNNIQIFLKRFNRKFLSFSYDFLAYNTILFINNVFYSKILNFSKKYHRYLSSELLNNVFNFFRILYVKNNYYTSY